MDCLCLSGRLDDASKIRSVRRIWTELLDHHTDWWRGIVLLIRCKPGAANSASLPPGRDRFPSCPAECGLAINFGWRRRLSELEARPEAKGMTAALPSGAVIQFPEDQRVRCNSVTPCRNVALALARVGISVLTGRLVMAYGGHDAIGMGAIANMAWRK